MRVKHMWLLAQRPGKLGASAALSAVYMFNVSKIYILK